MSFCSSNNQKYYDNLLLWGLYLCIISRCNINIYIYTKNIHVWCIIYVYIHIIFNNVNIYIYIYMHVRNYRNLLNWSARPYSFREKPAYQASFGFGHALGAHPDNSKQGGAHVFVFPSGWWIYCELMLIQYKNKERHGDMVNCCSNFFWGCDYKSNQLQLSFSYWFVRENWYKHPFDNQCICL
jgi:hypothetical protein